MARKSIPAEADNEMKVVPDTSPVSVDVWLETDVFDAECTCYWVELKKVQLELTNGTNTYRPYLNDGRTLADAQPLQMDEYVYFPETAVPDLATLQKFCNQHEIAMYSSIQEFCKDRGITTSESDDERMMLFSFSVGSKNYVVVNTDKYYLGDVGADVFLSCKERIIPIYKAVANGSNMDNWGRKVEFI